MRTSNQNTERVHKTSCQRISRALVALSALVLLQGCKTMEERQAYAQAFGNGLVHAAAINRQNREDHQRLVEWQNTHNNVGRALPMRPGAVQPVITQPVAPAYSNNPSQQFLNQGMWPVQGQ